MRFAITAAGKDHTEGDLRREDREPLPRLFDAKEDRPRPIQLFHAKAMRARGIAPQQIEVARLGRLYARRAVQSFEVQRERPRGREQGRDKSSAWISLIGGLVGKTSNSQFQLVVGSQNSVVSLHQNLNAA
jgi:hypothetical protein